MKAAADQDEALQVSGVAAELVRQPLIDQENIQETAPAEEPLNEGTVTIFEATAAAPVEKERLQPVYTDDLSDAAVTGAKIAPGP